MLPFFFNFQFIDEINLIAGADVGIGPYG